VGGVVVVDPPAAGAEAQTYPSRLTTLVVPFPPGGSTDAAARIMADHQGRRHRRAGAIDAGHAHHG